MERLTGDKQLDDAAKCLKMNFQDLVKYAESKDINTYDKTRIDLLTELGVTERKGGKVFVRPQPTAEKLRFLIERHYPIPMNTIFPEAEFNDWLKLVAEDPWAFNGLDLTDKKAEIQHTLKTKNKCFCGATVRFPKHPDSGKPLSIVICGGIPTVIHRKGKPIEVQKCLTINNFRKWVYHELPSAKEE